MLGRVIADYVPEAATPIAGRAGQRVVVDKTRKTDVAGWVWAVNAAGRGGWVPEAYLDWFGEEARLRFDYDAIELAIHVGERLTVHKAESGFYWATHEDGRQGGVPATHGALGTQ
jgi:hypothetical protein